MINRNKRLPADADANRSDEDVQNKHQEEFDDESKLRLDENARKQDARNEQREDSQLKHEDKIQILLTRVNISIPEIRFPK